MFAWAWGTKQCAIYAFGWSETCIFKEVYFSFCSTMCNLVQVLCATWLEWNNVQSEISLGDWLLFGASTMVLLFFFFLYFFLTDAEGLGGFFCCCFSFSLFCISFFSRIPYLCLKITSLTQERLKALVNSVGLTYDVSFELILFDRLKKHSF